MNTIFWLTYSSFLLNRNYDKNVHVAFDKLKAVIQELQNYK